MRKTLTYAEKILTEVERIDDILVKILATSKRPLFDLQMVSVAAITDQALEKIAAQLQAQKGVGGKGFRLPICRPSWLMPARSSRFFPTFSSIPCMPCRRGGRLGVVLKHDGTEIAIEVSDTGGGIPAENLSKIFEPFFTTKARGTGFGLSVVLRIVKTYRGRISVDSKPGEGVDLPRPPPPPGMNRRRLPPAFRNSVCMALRLREIALTLEEDESLLPAKIGRENWRRPRSPAGPPDRPPRDRCPPQAAGAARLYRRIQSCR